jgi:hypothetical protein
MRVFSDLGRSGRLVRPNLDGWQTPAAAPGTMREADVDVLRRAGSIWWLV